MSDRSESSFDADFDLTEVDWPSVLGSSGAKREGDGGHAEKGGPGLYLHVPFCRAICPYCDFAVVKDEAKGRRDYLSALKAELEFWSSRVTMRPDHSGFDTVYLGGGTPSALDAQELASVFAWIRHYLPIAEGARWSLEANPEDVDARSAGHWRELGVEFLSLGVQSLQPDGLTRLGRRHSAEQARSAIETAVDAGFETVSVDLIYCMAGQTEEMWRSELEAVVGLGPSHLSCYELTFHEGTPFGRGLELGSLRSMPEPSRARLFEFTHRHLSSLGYEGYEVSNFALPGARSPHNQKYWRHVPYLGLGPSAHSFDGRRRWWNRRDLKDWCAVLQDQQPPIAGSELLDIEQLQLEALMFALRTVEGTELFELEKYYAFDLEVLLARALPLVGEGLIEEVETVGAEARLQATLEGRAVAESLAVRLSAI